jgi:hypothetical protein
MLQPDTESRQGTIAHQPVETAPFRTAGTPAGTPATLPEDRVEVPEAQPANVIDEGLAVKPAPHEAGETGAVTEAVVESLRAPAEALPPPMEEVPESAEGASAGTAAAGSEVTTEVEPSLVPSEESPVEPGSEVPDSAAGPQPGAMAEETSSEAGITPEAVAPGQPLETTATQQSSPSAVPGEETAATTGTLVPTTAPPAATERQPGVSSPGPSPGTSGTAVKPYELLAAAREAFWLHNYDDAEKNYRALTELEPENPDGYGELGNMYFSQGRWEEAAAAYFEAGTRLISEGRLESARELVNVIRGLNGQQADELDKLITSAASTGND